MTDAQSSTFAPRTLLCSALLAVCLLLSAGACAGNASGDAPQGEGDGEAAEAGGEAAADSAIDARVIAGDIPEGLATAVFAGGCFWCMEPPYDRLDGVKATVSGYAGGEIENPSYGEVSSGRTRHREVLQVVYDPEVVSYDRLLEVFWRNVDPLDDGGQFCDRGYQYTTAVYAGSDQELARAEESKTEVAGRFDRPVVTPIERLDVFYPAEDYHQNFYVTNPTRYKSYRLGCRRDARLEQLWGDEAGG